MWYNKTRRWELQSTPFNSIMIGLILMVCLAAIIGAVAVYVYMRPKVKTCIELDEKTRIQNEELRTEQMELTKTNANLLAQKNAVI